MTPRSLRRRALDVLVVGAGQAGLAMGRELERDGRDFLILDAAPTLGHSWRTRWDSLRLFTPAAFSALPGIPFPGDPEHHPTKEAVADYLGAYARAFSLPIGLDEGVRSLRLASDGTFLAATDHARYRARNVVVATGSCQAPRIPRFAATLPPTVHQLHASAYRAPSDVGPGPVVVVGGGNSGVQIADELSRTHEVTLAVGTSHRRLPAQLFGRSIFYWLNRSGAMDVASTSRIGRRWRRQEFLIGESPRRLARAGRVRLAGRAQAAQGAALRTASGGIVPATTVIWATGYRPSFDWIRLPGVLHDGRPRHVRGEASLPGLYFLGLPWLHTRGSALLGWVARDAAWIAARIAHRLHAPHLAD
jgi:putative flavoprotein involved in K+ transport